jgi:hypothetical protein
VSLQLVEAWKSGEGSMGLDSTDTYSAIVRGDPDTDDAENPVTMVRFAIQHFAMVSQFGNIFHSFDRERIAPGTWLVTATYKSPTHDRQTNDASFSFTTGGGTAHVSASIATKSAYASPTITDGNGQVRPPAIFKGAIGFNGDAVEGTDIHVATFDFKLTYYLDPADLKPDYLKNLYRLSSRVNSDAVTVNVDGLQLTFKPGELLYLGADGSKRSGYNITDGVIGDIRGIVKNGWDYLWVLFEDQKDMAAGKTVPRPLSVYVEQVYVYEALTPLIRNNDFDPSQASPWTRPTFGGGPAII